VSILAGETIVFTPANNHAQPYFSLGRCGCKADLVQARRLY
jgi:hypothetical protein